MTTLITKMKADLLEARKSKNLAARSALPPLIGDCEAIGKKALRAPTDSEVIAIVKSFVKKANEVLKVNSNPETLTEIKLYNRYLPQQLSVDRLDEIISEYACDEGGKINIGMTMGYLKANFEGQYDGRIASQRILKFLET